MIWPFKKSYTPAPETIQPLRMLTGIEKHEREEAAKAKLEADKLSAEADIKRRTRIAELRKEIGPQLQELEGLEAVDRQIYMQMGLQNAIWSPGSLINVSRDYPAFSALFGGIGNSIH